MTQTQTDDAQRSTEGSSSDTLPPAQNDSKQAANGLVIEKETSEPSQPSKPESGKKKPKLVLIVGAIALLAGVGYGVYHW